MTQSDSGQTLLAINSTEWLNLCARGSIRISKRRPIKVANSASNREMEKVFCSAPFTKVGSSIDLFVLVIENSWQMKAQKHRSHPSEILQLNLTDVIQHQPVSLEHLEYYRNIGSKCGIQLSSPIFEQAWLHWVINETITASCDAADLLQRTFDIPLSSKTKRADRYKWNDIARLVLRPNEPVKTKPAHAETLLSNIRKIADAVAATRDSEQFYLACAIEWVEIRLRKDPLKKKAIKDTLLSALSKAKESPLRAPSEETSAALELLAETFPKAFTEEVSPLSISNVVQLLTESRTRELKTETVTRIVQSLDKTSSTATFTTFVLATSLGIELTTKLASSMNQVNLVDMNWDSPN